MSKKEKLLEKVRNALNSTRPKELLTLMNAYGFIPKKTRHGYLFKHEKLVNKKLPHVSVPHNKENKVLKCYVIECIDAIEELKLFKGD